MWEDIVNFFGGRDVCKGPVPPPQQQPKKKTSRPLQKLRNFVLMKSRDRPPLPRLSLVESEVPESLELSPERVPLSGPLLPKWYTLEEEEEGEDLEPLPFQVSPTCMALDKPFRAVDWWTDPDGFRDANVELDPLSDVLKAHPATPPSARDYRGRLTFLANQVRELTDLVRGPLRDPAWQKIPREFPNRPNRGPPPKGLFRCARKKDPLFPIQSGRLQSTNGEVLFRTSQTKSHLAPISKEDGP